MNWLLIYTLNKSALSNQFIQKLLNTGTVEDPEALRNALDQATKQALEAKGRREAVMAYQELCKHFFKEGAAGQSSIRGVAPLLGKVVEEHVAFWLPKSITTSDDFTFHENNKGRIRALMSLLLKSGRENVESRLVAIEQLTQTWQREGPEGESKLVSSIENRALRKSAAGLIAKAGSFSFNEELWLWDGKVAAK